MDSECGRQDSSGWWHMPAEEEGGQDVSGRKMQFLNMQNVIPLQEGTIQHGRSDISTSPFRFLLLMENFYHSLCGFQHHKVITLQLFRAEGQHRSQQATSRGQQSCVIFWKFWGESGSLPFPAPRGCPHYLVPGPSLYLQSPPGQVESSSVSSSHLSLWPQPGQVLIFRPTR